MAVEGDTVDAVRDEPPRLDITRSECLGGTEGRRRDPVIAYGAKWCEVCRNLEKDLDRRGVPYTFIDVDDPHAMASPAGAHAAEIPPKKRRGVPVTRMVQKNGQPLWVSGGDATAGTRAVLCGGSDRACLWRDVRATGGGACVASESSLVPTEFSSVPSCLIGIRSFGVGVTLTHLRENPATANLELPAALDNF